MTAPFRLWKYHRIRPNLITGRWGDQMKAGTRVVFDGREGPDYIGTVMRWHTPSNGPRSAVPGYQKVKFDVDSGPILVHESRLAEVAP